MQNSKADLYQIRVKESIGDVISGLARSLTVEIVFAPFSAIRKTLVTSKRYKIDSNCQETLIENRGRSSDW
jgi:hypothetical protein